MKSQVDSKGYKYPAYWSDEDKINFDLPVNKVNEFIRMLMIT
jgi:hypothetical protein